MVARLTTIRPAERTDVESVATLIGDIERFYGSSDVQPFAERCTQVTEALFGSPPLAFAFLAEGVAGEIVGLASYSFLWPAAGSTHSLFLKELYVQASDRRQGIGARFVRELRTLAIERPGCSRIEWMTDRDNSSARAFYQAVGFSEIGGKIIYRVDTRRS
ncbi:cyclophane-containing RiPP N-acetyltransferase HaaN [Streptomyces sp. NPDC056549]|uniref:cyclophane-containing RiPP N-acetyltransferase HaaN n=1 Tax=Streptomyces sp. NPDC056549 TaxID=3345864 RepID=UPI0036BC6F26